MTNHPRRVGRRKQQLQFERNLPGLREMARATTATAEQMRRLHVAVRDAAGHWTDLTSHISSVRLGDARIDVDGLPPVRRTVDIDLREPA